MAAATSVMLRPAQCCAVLCGVLQVERAKKCLDFGSTCYIWHTIFVCWYSGWPQSFAWWVCVLGVQGWQVQDSSWTGSSGDGKAVP